MIQQPLSPKAVPAWRLTQALASLYWLALPVLYVLRERLGLGGLPEHPAFQIAVFAIPVGVWIFSVAALPVLRWRQWRYRFDEGGIELRRGILVIRETVVPMSRVQHVDTRQGPVFRWFGLSSVRISTAAGAHEIPALDEPTAQDLLRSLSDYAQLAVDDV